MILTVEIGTVQDGNGDFVPGTKEIIEKDCRAEPSGGNGYIKTADGTAVNYSWIVYFGLPVDKIVEGTEIEVVDQKTLESILKDKVLRFSRGQLNARVWL